MIKFFHTHNFVTVAIDSGYASVRTINGKQTREIDHVVKFKECECGARIYEWDATPDSPPGHQNNAIIAAEKWISFGNLVGTKKLEIFDKKYMPRHGLDAALNRLKNDKEFNELYNLVPAVEQAFGQLEVMTKMAYDNTKLTKTD